MIYLFLFIAGLCNSIMDIVSSGYFVKSIFRNLDPYWWDKSLSWNNHNLLKARLEKYGIPSWLSVFLSGTLLVMFCDAWHFFKFLMWVSLSLAMVWNSFTWASFLGDYLLITVTFTICYNYILRKHRS